MLARFGLRAAQHRRVKFIDLIGIVIGGEKQKSQRIRDFRNLGMADADARNIIELLGGVQHTAARLVTEQIRCAKGARNGGGRHPCLLGNLLDT
jgi:hypothetical protein